MIIHKKAAFAMNLTVLREPLVFLSFRSTTTPTKNLKQYQISKLMFNFFTHNIHLCPLSIFSDFR